MEIRVNFILIYQKEILTICAMALKVSVLPLERLGV